jgi:hypothetical protein
MQSAEALELIEQFLVLSYRHVLRTLNRRQRRQRAILLAIFAPQEGAGGLRRLAAFNTHYHAWLGTPSAVTTAEITSIRVCDVDVVLTDPPRSGEEVRISIEGDQRWHHFQGRVLASHRGWARVSLDSVLPADQAREPLRQLM